jgi:hypothetical protein
MKKILAILTAIVALLPLVAADDGGGGSLPVTAETYNTPLCGLILTPSTGTTLDFGTLIHGIASGDKTVNVVNDGTTPTTNLEIEGADWLPASTPVSFLVDSTHYAESDIAYGSMTSLLTTNAQIHGGVLSHQASFDTHFKLTIPHGVTAGSYTQVITFTSTC